MDRFFRTLWCLVDWLWYHVGVGSQTMMMGNSNPCRDALIPLGMLPTIWYAPMTSKWSSSDTVWTSPAYPLNIELPSFIASRLFSLCAHSPSYTHPTWPIHRCTLPRTSICVHKCSTQVDDTQSNTDSFLNSTITHSSYSPHHRPIIDLFSNSNESSTHS